MLRFGTKTLLFVFVLVALWFSTFSGYSAGRDVRASVLLIVFLTSGFAAVYSRGRERAFWAGFFAVMLLAGGNFFEGPGNKYVPNFFWRTMQPTPYNISYPAAATYYATPTYSAPPSPTPAQPSPMPAPAMAPQPAIPVTVLPVMNDYSFKLAVNDSIEAIWRFVLGGAVGLIGMWVYSTMHRDRREA